MRCPVCGTWTIVKETRTSTGNTRRRRLECANEHRFTTLENVIVPKTSVHKKQKDFGISTDFALSKLHD
jgi:transcriptional regulator NrdR family protein